MSIQVPKVKFDEMELLVCCQQITEGFIPKTVFFAGTEYAITGSMSNNGDRFVFAYRVVCVYKYNGTLKPLEYSRHFLAVDLGERERCYNGLLTKNGKRRVVLVGDEVCFAKSQEGTQTALF